MTWDALNGLQYNTLLKLGSKGSAVSELQGKLIAKGYSVGFRSRWRFWICNI